MPRGGLDVQDGVLDPSQVHKMAIEGGLDLGQVARDLRSLLTAKDGQLFLFAIFPVGKVHLTVADLPR